MENKHKDHFLSLILSLCYLIFIFQDPISSYIALFNYFDEVFALFLLVISTIQLIVGKQPKSSLKLFVTMVLILVIGISSNFVSKYQVSLSPILIDAFSVIKIIPIFIVFKDIVEFKVVRKACNNIALLLYIYIIAAMVGYVLTLAGYSNFLLGTRYGLPQYKFIYENPGIFGYILISIFGIIYLSNQNYKKIFLFLICLLSIVTLKGPQIIFSLGVIFFYLFKKRNIQLKFYHFIILGIIIVLISGYQIKEYLLNDTSARYLLTKYGFVTANNTFPFGSGFATYGSEMSRRYYSKLYYIYGFNKVWGLNLEYSYFINDAYWQMIFAQLGYFGAVICIYLYIKIFKIIKFNSDSKDKFYIYAVYIAFLVGSIGSAYLTHATGVFAFIFLGSLSKVTKDRINVYE